VYEYLASGVPVAAPPLRALEGLGGVYVDDDLVLAVDRAREASRPDPSRALAEHSWGARIETLLGSIDRDVRPVEQPTVSVVTRPPRRYRKADRWVR
jgi:hypothetical protein